MRRMFAIGVGLLLCLASVPALADNPCPPQSTPTFTAGGTVFGRAAAQWNAYFGIKADSFGGCIYNAILINPIIQSGLSFGGIWSPANGGTGVNNGANSITLGGPLTISGNFATTLTVTGDTHATLPAGTHTLAPTDNPAFTGGTIAGASNITAHLPNLTAMIAAPHASYPQGVWRNAYATAGDAPPLFYRPLTGTCASNSLINDGGACIDASDGNSFKASFPTGLTDVREFGAIADGSTDSYTAILAAKAYAATIGACAYVPSIYPGFVSRTAITLNNATGSDCLIGDRGFKLYPPTGPGGSAFGKFVDINFPNDTDGIVIAANNGWYVGGLAIKGHAAETTSVATHTRGIFLQGSFDGKIENMVIQDFVVCKYYLASANKFAVRDVSCDEQTAYPNIVNEYPFACTEMDNGGIGAAAAFQEDGGECRAAAGGNGGGVYVSDGTTPWFQACMPLTGTPTVTTGIPLNCNFPEQYGVPLWRADGVKVRVGNGTTLPNGQFSANAPLKKCGVDFTVWDVSASGGGVKLTNAGISGTTLTFTSAVGTLANGYAITGAGVTAGTVITGGSGTTWTVNHSQTVGPETMQADGGGVQLICLQTTATLNAGVQTITLPSTAGLRAGTDILITGDHGIQVATKINTVSGDGVSLVMSTPAFITESNVPVSITQIAVATNGAGGSYSKACQSTPGQGVNPASCGFQIEVRLSSIPSNGTDVTLQWGDPTGYVAYLADAVSDYVFLRPTLVGGYDFGLIHTGLTDGGLELRPTYIELLNQCVSINRTALGAPYGDVVDLHRVINDPIPNCPGYVDPTATPNRITYNNDLTTANLNSANGAPADPTGTGSATAVMMGLGASCKITPLWSSKLTLDFTGVAANSTAAAGADLYFRLGTGSAPSNGVAVTTDVMAPRHLPIQAIVSGATIPFDLHAVYSGLTPGVPYWFDMALLAPGGTGTASVKQITCTAHEF